VLIAENQFSSKYFEDKINKYCKEKFTLELCHDGYFHLIPNSYIVKDNKILIQSLASYGSLKYLKKAFDKKCLLESDIDGYCVNDYAAMGGHLNIIKWARDYLFVINTCKYAAKFGHLSVLKWLRKHNCEWDHLTINNAAKYNHFDIFKWAFENECKFDNHESFTCVAESGNLDMINYVFDTLGWPGDCST
jgi:hypothetical protein